MSTTPSRAPMTSHQALRVLLTALAVIAALVGVSILFAPHWVFSISGAPQIAAQPLLILFAQAFGPVALALSYLMYVTSRDPVRYAAVIDAAVIGLVLVVALEVYAIVAGGLGQIWSPALLWTSVVIRTLIAVALFVLRPRESA